MEIKANLSQSLVEVEAELGNYHIVHSYKISNTIIPYTGIKYQILSYHTQVLNIIICILSCMYNIYVIVSHK